MLAASLLVESLEARNLLTGSGLNGTLDQAQLLGDLSTQPRTDVVGTIGNSSAGAAGVNWYSFTLDGPAHVSLDLRPSGTAHPLNGVLSLYNNDLFDFQDLYDPLGYRLLTQALGSPGADPVIERDLGPGTYEVAVSGAGDTNFDPLLAGSGFAGATGDYDLQLSAGALDIGPNDGPAVLTSDPAPNAVLSASPLAIRLDFGSVLDPSTVIADQTIRLTYNPNGSFGDGNDQDVPLAWTNVGVNGTELQLAPAAPLAPGDYQVSLAGNSNNATPVVADLNGVPLGANSANPQGQDYTETFQINGIDGQMGANAASDNTVANAHQLGDLSAPGTGLIQVAGAIGNDPYYDNSDTAHNPANQVNLYHFQISGGGHYAFLAEVFAGRIGSPLDPGVSLFQVDPGTGTLVFVAGNNDTLDTVVATDGSRPLVSDSMLSQGLTAGDYYLAVADGFNTPSPAELQPMGSPGVLDPDTPNTAQNGFTTGPYVLNLLLQPNNQAPQVISTSPAQGAVLAQPPTYLTVQFSEPVNVQQQGYLNFLATSFCTDPAVNILGADGTPYYARVDSYDQATNQVTFLMLSHLPAGSYTLHLSGPEGVADLGGNPLVGNDPSGDYIVHFTVTAPDPVQLDSSDTESHIDVQLGPNGSEDLGVLFPYDVQPGVTLINAPTRDTGAGGGAAGTEQTYQFGLLQDQSYFFTLRGDDLPTGAHLALQGIDGNTVPLGIVNGGLSLFGEILPGTYELTVDGLTSATPYQVEVTMTGQAASPVPLVTGPAPGLQLHFVSISSPSGSGGVSSTGGNGTSSGTTTTTGGSSSAPGGGTTGGSSSAPGSGTNSGTPSTSLGSSTPGGGTSSSSVNLLATAAGGGGNGVNFGPFANGQSGVPSTTIAANNGEAAQGPLLVVINIPSQDPSMSPVGAGPVGGTTGDAISVTPVTAGISAGTITTAVSSQVENLVSANLALVGVGPVGGVQQTGNAVATAQVVQVALPIQGSVPIPTNVVTLLTLTRAGEIAALAGPADLAEIDLSNPVLVAAPVVGAVAATNVAGPVPRVGDEQPEIAAGLPLPPPRASAVAAATDTSTAVLADPPEQIATAIPQAPATGEGGTMLEDAGVANIDSLATANGPWLIIMAVLGTVTVYARRRRMAWRAAAAKRYGAGADKAQNLFRFWSVPAAGKLPHGIRSGRKSRSATATPRPNAGPRPRHLTNP